MSVQSRILDFEQSAYNLEVSLSGRALRKLGPERRQSSEIREQGVDVYGPLATCGRALAGFIPGLAAIGCSYFTVHNSFITRPTPS